MRYFAFISYDGTDFHGWQIQPNARSVQEEVERALSLLGRNHIEATGCGRTDTGVHADNFCLHFDWDHLIPDIRHFLFQINGILPKSIVFKSLVEAPERHARFDATRRYYRYDIHSSKSPFHHRYSTFYPLVKEFDRSRLDEVADVIYNTDDFKSFCKTRTDVKTTQCQVFESRWIFDDSHWTYRIAADRFLRGMVRLIVGTSLRVAEGKIAIEDLKENIAAGARPSMAWSAPAQGLMLYQVDYPFIKDSASDLA